MGLSNEEKAAMRKLDISGDGTISKKEVLTHIGDTLLKFGTSSKYKIFVEECSSPWPTPTPNLDREIEVHKSNSSVLGKLIGKIAVGVSFDTKDISEDDICRVVRDAQKQLPTLPAKTSKSTQKDL